MICIHSVLSIFVFFEMSAFVLPCLGQGSPWSPKKQFTLDWRRNQEYRSRPPARSIELTQLPPPVLNARQASDRAEFQEEPQAHNRTKPLALHNRPNAQNYDNEHCHALPTYSRINVLVRRGRPSRKPPQQ